MEKRGWIGPKELMGSLKHRVRQLLPHQRTARAKKRDMRYQKMCSPAVDKIAVKIVDPQHKTETMLIVSFVVLIFIIFLSRGNPSFSVTGKVAHEAIPVDSCSFDDYARTWENGKTYVLTQDLVLSAGMDCLNIQEKQDIILDCQGHSITIDPAATFRQPPRGIYLNGNGLTVRNCRIANFPFTGILINGNHTLLEHNTIENNREGVEVATIPAPRFGSSITSTTLQNNLIQNNVRFGVVMRGSNSIVRGNVIQGNGRTGLHLVDTAVVENTVLCNNNRENLPDEKDLKCGGGSNNPSQGQGNFIGTLERCFVLNALAWPTESDYQACDQAPPLSPDVGVPVAAPPAGPAPGSENGPCINGACNPSFTCLHRVLGDVGLCKTVAKVAAGAECPLGINAQCPDGSVCRKLFVRGDITKWSGNKYFCKGPMADGGICNRADQCGAGKSCVNGRCGVPPAPPPPPQEQQPPPPPSCTDTDAGQPDEGRGVKGTATGIVALDFPEYGLRQGQQASYEDRCNGDMLLEGFCDRDGKVSITGFGCVPGGKVCRDGACVASQAGRACVNNADCGEGLRCLSQVCQTRVCSETDGGNDPAVPGVITLDNSITNDIINQDACQNDASVLEYFCLPSHESSRQAVMCPQGTTCQTNAQNVGACVAPEAPPPPPAELSENDACGENIPTPCRQGLLCRKSNPASQTLQCLLPSVQGGFCEETDDCTAGFTCQTNHCLPPPQCRTQADEQAHGGDCNHCVSMPELMRYIAEWNNQDPAQRQLADVMQVTQAYYDSLADQACQQP